MTPMTDPAREEVPYIRKVGRYLFFAVCAFGCSLIGYAAGMRFGFNADVARMLGTAAMLASFLALRDMDKNARAPTLTNGGTDA